MHIKCGVCECVSCSGAAGAITLFPPLEWENVEVKILMAFFVQRKEHLGHGYVNVFFLSRFRGSAFRLLNIR